MNAKMEIKRERLKTYSVGKPNEAPYFIEKKQYQGASGKVYPLAVTDQITSETEEKEYEMICLENDYIAVKLLPELGGKIHGARAKENNYEFIYENPVIKPALIGLAGPWVSGGVEFNWPQHHRPTTFMKVEYRVRENSDGSVTCFMGEAEPFERMRGTAAVTVYPDRSYVEVKGIITNCSDHALPFMWWNNTAVRVDESYKAIFPPDIEYGSDHDRRAIISFPVMRGVFDTARPYDYGEGTDATWYKNVKVPTSVMIPRGETGMDFLGGYDYGRDAGTVIISDHHDVPGKKMFTWANCEFGKKWCANLTDNGDRYMELMTGVFTDNQPDFAYIEPGETKEFSQLWYPVKGIGGLSNAGKEGTLLLERSEAGSWKIGASVTKLHEKLRLSLELDGEIIYERKGALNPTGYWLEEVKELPGAEKAVLYLRDENENELLSYKISEKGRKQPPMPRRIMPRPDEINSIELLYLCGKHLQQYKHGTYRAEDYYLEALKREGGDYRCNLEMGKIELEKGRCSLAELYLKTAMERLTWKNTSPEDTEVYYQMGRVKCQTGKQREAYGFFRAATWQYPYRSPGFFECACISTAFGERERAVKELQKALETNTKFYAARTLLGYLTGDSEMERKILEESPLETPARLALFLMEDREIEPELRNRSEDMLDGALLFKKAGLLKEAAVILKKCENPSPDLLFHLWDLTGEEPGDISNAYCFPNRLEDIPVLQPGGWQAQYLLGCLYYARDNYEDAAAAWERSLREGGEGWAYNYRNLAIAYYDHLGRRDRSMVCMRKAVELKPTDARLIYELMQLEKVENLPLKERINTTVLYADQVKQRDDAYLDSIILRIQNGEYGLAGRMLRDKDFHIYEGGEGKLTKYHRWLHILEATQEVEKENLEAAEKILSQALVYPDSYGEGKGFLEQDANVHYLAGRLKEQEGRAQEAFDEYRKVEDEPFLVNEMLFFAGLCREKMGNSAGAKELYQRLLTAGEEYESNPARYGYFGVGMEAPLPFESDIVRNNLTKAYLYRLLALRGLHREEAAKEEKRKLKELEPDQPLVMFLERLKLV